MESNPTAFIKSERPAQLDEGNGLPEWLTNPTKLQGSPTAAPVYAARVKEQPWHRIAATMLANGMTQKAVAEALDRTPASISQLMQNPWFCESVAREMAKNGRSVQDLVVAEAFQSLATLIDIRNDLSTPASVRARVSDSLLDRAFGKAVNRTEVAVVRPSSDPVAEANRLAAANSNLLERSNTVPLPMAEPNETERLA